MVAFRAGKDDNFIRAGAARHPFGVCFARTLDEDFDTVADQRQVVLGSRAVNFLEQDLVPAHLLFFGNLAFHGCRRRVLPGRVPENERLVERDGPQEIQCFQEIGFGFTRKADDDVGGDGGVRNMAADLPDDLQVFFSGVGAAHPFQDPVGSGLKRQVNMLTKFRQTSERLDQIRLKTNGMRGGEADSFDAIHLVNGLEKLDKRRFSADPGKLMPAEQVHNLAQKGDLFDAVLCQLTAFADNVCDGTAAFGAPG